MIASSAFMTTPKQASSLSPSRIEQLRGQAQELEGIFLNTLLKEMFSSLKTQDDTVGGGGFAEETWRGMQAEQLSITIAQTGGIGLADSILPDLIAAQEAAQNATKSRGAPHQ